MENGADEKFAMQAAARCYSVYKIFVRFIMKTQDFGESILDL